MKSIFSILLFSLPILLFSQNQERLSVHYFDVPQELESKFLKFNSDVNEELEKAGFGKDFFVVFMMANISSCFSFGMGVLISAP